VISRKQPERILDLLGYQSLLIDAYQEYKGDSWNGYDRRFHLSAAANATKVWACINPTLWNLAFTGNVKTSRCTHCFSLTHTSSDCKWAPDPSTSTVQPTAQPTSKDNAGFVTSGTVFLANAQYLVALMTMYAFIVLMTLPSMKKFTKVFIAPSRWDAKQTTNVIATFQDHY